MASQAMTGERPGRWKSRDIGGVARAGTRPKPSDNDEPATVGGIEPSGFVAKTRRVDCLLPRSDLLPGLENLASAVHPRLEVDVVGAAELARVLRPRCRTAARGHQRTDAFLGGRRETLRLGTAIDLAPDQDCDRPRGVPWRYRGALAPMPGRWFCGACPRARALSKLARKAAGRTHPASAAWAMPRAS